MAEKDKDLIEKIDKENNIEKIIDNGFVHMARLCVFVSKKVNGVSKIHSEIIKKEVFYKFKEKTPEKFLNITNGVSQRKWLINNNDSLKNLIERKMISDKLVTNYNNEIIKGTNILMKYPKGIIISGVGIITNQREVVFIKECYTKEFSDIRSIPVIKWEIIKKSIDLGYRNFDLGDVKITKNQITKTGYNGNIIEYSNNFDLIINDMLYKLNGFANKFNKTSVN